MLLDGNKGAVLQRDGRTYAVAPHLQCGLVTPAMLRKIADVAEKYGATLKCTGAQRIAIIGLREQDVDAVWTDLGGQNPGHMTGDCVRSVKACPGTHFCKRAHQDSLGLGLILDQRYHGKPLPGKLKIGVSGCANQCSETCIKDIGLIGTPRGWTILIGGMGGSLPKLARELTDRVVSMEEALSLVDKIVEFFKSNARPGERLGELLARIGILALRNGIGLD